MSTSTTPAPATGPRAMAEQSILKIIWPPDGRPAWEDRHKIPRIEQALGQLLDIVEGDDVKPAAIKARESQKLTAQIIDLRRQGLTMAQIAEVTGLTEYAVIHRISNSKKMQTANSVDAGPVQESANPPPGAQQDVKSAKDEPFSCHHENGQGEPAALRSAASDQIVEANNMITDIDPEKTKPHANDETFRNVPRAEQAQPKTEQVSGLAPLREERPEQNENPTIRKDRIVEESKEVPKPKKQPKIPHSEDEYIFAERNGGKKFREIYGAIASRGVVCELDDVVARFYQVKAQKAKGQNVAEVQKTAENVPAVQSSDTPPQPQKDVMLLQQPANVADTSQAAPKPTEDKPAPKAIGRAELDAKIWELWKKGKSPAEISDTIWDEGYYYNEKSVIIRLRSQGANL